MRKWPKKFAAVTFIAALGRRRHAISRTGVRPDPVLPRQNHHSHRQHGAGGHRRFARQSVSTDAAQTYSGKSDNLYRIHGRRRRAQGGQLSISQLQARRLYHRSVKRWYCRPAGDARERGSLRHRKFIQLGTPESTNHYTIYTRKELGLSNMEELRRPAACASARSPSAMCPTSPEGYSPITSV